MWLADLSEFDRMWRQDALDSNLSRFEVFAQSVLISRESRYPRRIARNANGINGPMSEFVYCFTVLQPVY